jgi:isopropylmalate/homocitrate/citramalate synthase
MDTPWIKENKWYVSNYNFNPEVQKEITLSDIEISDCTLRDGEQQPGVQMNADDKVQIARALDELGVHYIEAGMPAVTEEDRKAITQMTKAGLNAKILAFCWAREDHIKLARDCGVWGVLLSLPSSEIRIKEAFGWTHEKLIETGIEITNYAHDQGLFVIFSVFDTTRSDFNFLSHFAKSVIDQGHVDRLRIVDTNGCVSSPGMGYLIKQVKKLTNLPLEIHCHDDFGLATANTLAAAQAGANVLSTTMNGLGARSGNASTEEVASALLMLYGYDTGLKYEKLFQVSQLVQRLTGVALQPHKAVVGENAFAHSTGGSMRGFAKGNPFISEAYLPELVGQKFRFLIGKSSGTPSIKVKLQELSLTVGEDKIPILLEKVKELSQRTKKNVTDEEFREMVRQVSGS